MAAEPERITDLFKNPSGEAMYALTPKEFEHVVAYALRRAGYDVKEVGPHFLKVLIMKRDFRARCASSAVLSVNDMLLANWCRPQTLRAGRPSSLPVCAACYRSGASLRPQCL